jgi:CopG family nickel-responsive transcriptional regulator
MHRHEEAARLARFGVSIEESLLEAFDTMVAEKGFANRSDALRSMIRSQLLETRIEQDPDAEVIGTISLVYDHGSRELPARLTDMQHRHHTSIVSTLHVHFDAHNCLEVIVVRGRLADVRAISDSLTGARGVQQGRLIINAAARAPGRKAGGRPARPRRA